MLAIFKDQRLELWPLPRGELLAAWPQEGLHVALADGSGAALVLRLAPPTAHLVVALPGAGACATGRRGLLVAKGFFALMEDEGAARHRAVEGGPLRSRCTGRPGDSCARRWPACRPGSWDRRRPWWPGGMAWCCARPRAFRLLAGGVGAAYDL